MRGGVVYNYQDAVNQQNAWQGMTGFNYGSFNALTNAAGQAGLSDPTANRVASGLLQKINEPLVPATVQPQQQVQASPSMAAATLPTLGPGGGAPVPAAPTSNASPATPATPGNPYTIAGSLPFQNMQQNIDFSGNPANLSADYAQSYQNALSLNAANYNNIMQGYQQTTQNQLGAQGQLNQDYTNLGANVQGLIAGTDQNQMNQVNNLYAQNLGNINASLANRGLGNTTIGGSMATGNALSQAQAQTDVANRFAQLQAGYASQIGLAGLNQKNVNMQANTALAGKQLDFMNSVNSPYPNGQLYGQLAAQWGAAQQAAANRAQAGDQFNRLMSSSNRSVPGGGGGAQLPAGAGGGFTRTPGMFSPGVGGPQSGPSGAGIGGMGLGAPGLGPATSGGALGKPAGSAAGNVAAGAGAGIAGALGGGPGFWGNLANQIAGGAGGAGGGGPPATNLNNSALGDYYFGSGSPATNLNNSPLGDYYFGSGGNYADYGAYGWAGGPSLPNNLNNSPLGDYYFGGGYAAGNVGSGSGVGAIGGYFGGGYSGYPTMNLDNSALGSYYFG